MNHATHAPVTLAAAHFIGVVALAMMLLASFAAPEPAAAETNTPVVWAEMHEMDPPCYTEYCFRILYGPGIAIVGAEFAPFASVGVRFTSLDGSRESFSLTTEADSTGDIRFETGERVCDGWLGSPLEATGLPEEHAWEVRAEVLTTKPGVPVMASNFLFLYSCGDGPVG